MEVIDFLLHYVVSFIVLISVLVFIHELGHFLFARWCGVYVESFSIGFGKELFGFTDKKGTRWKIAPLPLGGYVKMKGEMILNPKDATDDKDSFHNKKLWQKALIVFAGPLFNFIFPIIVFLFICIFFNTKVLMPQIKSVEESSSSYKLLLPGDIVKKVNGKEINTFSELRSTIVKMPNKIVKLEVERGNKAVVVTTKIDEKNISNTRIGFLGIQANDKAIANKKYGFLQSIKNAFNMYIDTCSNILYGFKMLLTNKLSLNDLGGPIKIAEISGQIIQGGVSNWLYFLAALSINLAIVNLIPIPALDGGHLFIYLIQAVIRKPVSAKLQNTLMAFGFYLLIGLILIITFNDIFRLFK